MTKKEKIKISPNECSLGRWIVMLVVSIVLGSVLSAFVSVLKTQLTAPVFGVIPVKEFEELLTFVVMFISLVVSIKVIGKTSVKDFILGVGGKVNIKQSLIVLVLYALGISLSYLIVIGNIKVRDVSLRDFGILFIVMLLVTWTQTTWEEFVFRGVGIRWACKNNVGFTKRAIIVAVVTSLLFALPHFANPEVTSKSGIDIAVAGLVYALNGFFMFVANLYFGNLLPSIIIHWFNNFVVFTIISGEVTAMPLPTLLIDATPHSAVMMLVSALIVYLPLMLYILVDALRKRKSASVG